MLTSGRRSPYRRLRVRMRRALSPALETIAFFEAGVAALWQVFAGTPGRRSPKRPTKRKRMADKPGRSHRFAPFPVDD